MSNLMRWRQIKSAPKDGTMILLAEPIGNGAEGYNVWWGRWIDVPHENRRDEKLDREDDEAWIASYAAVYSSGADDAAWHLKPIIVFRPTHWMPTPAPPKVRTKR
jgi:hypothetical protein